MPNSQPGATARRLIHRSPIKDTLKGRATMMIRYALFLMSLFLISMPRTSASDIDRYLESTTAVVAHVDLQQLDVPAIIQFIETQLPDVVPDQARAAATG